MTHNRIIFDGDGTAMPDQVSFGAAWQTVTLHSDALTTVGRTLLVVASDSLPNATLRTIHGGDVGDVLVLRAAPGHSIALTQDDNLAVSTTLDETSALVLLYDGARWQALQGMVGSAGDDPPPSETPLARAALLRPSETVYLQKDETIKQTYALAAHNTLGIALPASELVLPYSGLYHAQAQIYTPSYEAKQLLFEHNGDERTRSGPDQTQFLQWTFAFVATAGDTLAVRVTNWEPGTIPLTSSTQAPYNWLSIALLG